MTDSEQIVKNYEIKSDTEKLASAILDVMEVAQSHGVQCWLNYGALLGLVRENRLLPWNNDAHVTCWIAPDMREKFKLITDTLNRKGYHTYFYSTVGAVSAKTKGADVAINCYWREGKYAVRPHETPSEPGYAAMSSSILYWIAAFMGAYPRGFVGNCRKPLSRNEFIKIIFVSMFRCVPVALRKKLFLLFIHWSKMCGGQFQKTAIPAEYFDNLVMREFYGGEVLVPDNPEKLLQFIYGKGWNIPKVDWSFYDEDKKKDSGMLFIDEMWDYSQIEII